MVLKGMGEGVVARSYPVLLLCEAWGCVELHWLKLQS